MEYENSSVKRCTLCAECVCTEKSANYGYYGYIIIYINTEIYNIAGKDEVRDVFIEEAIAKHDGKNDHTQKN